MDDQPIMFNDFTRARRGRKVPSVLTQAECKRLFEAMGGTSRLMAELMYAAGMNITTTVRMFLYHVVIWLRRARSRVDVSALLCLSCRYLFGHRVITT